MSDDRQRERDPTLKRLATVASGTEATILIGDLESYGIWATERPDSGSGAVWGGLHASRAVYVAEQDFARASEVLNAKPMSEDELAKAAEDAALATEPDSPTSPKK